MPRYILLLHGDQTSEAEQMPPRETFSEMHAYNKKLASAGILLGAEGLYATSKGARVSFPPPDPATPNKPSPKSGITVTKGPFGYSMNTPDGKSGELKPPVCGFWILRAKDLEEAVGWAKKAPLAGTYVEVRQIQEICDLPPMMEWEEDWRKEMEKNK